MSETEYEAQLAEETCMCGDPMDDHSIGSGHTPVSMADYYGRNRPMTETPKLRTPLRIMEVHQDCYKIIGSDNVIVGTSTKKEFAQDLKDAANERERLREALRGLLTHPGIADADPSDKDPEDHALERRARQALKGEIG